MIVPAEQGRLPSSALQRSLRVSQITTGRAVSGTPAHEGADTPTASNAQTFETFA
jgi:hypothetical protein